MMKGFQNNSKPASEAVKAMLPRNAQRPFHVVARPHADTRFLLRDGAANAGEGAAPREKKPAASCVALRGGARKGRTGGFLASTGSSQGVRLADLRDFSGANLAGFRRILKRFFHPDGNSLS